MKRGVCVSFSNTQFHSSESGTVFIQFQCPKALLAYTPYGLMLGFSAFNITLMLC